MNAPGLSPDDELPPENSSLEDLSPENPPQVTGFWRVIYAVAALLFFVLGALGLLLPGLPTTPFLLLTSYFLVRISPQLNQRLLRSRFVGGILTDWQVKRGVRSSVKVRAVSVVTLAVGATVYFSRERPWLAAVTVLLAAVGITVIMRLPGIDEPPVSCDSRTGRSGDSRTEGPDSHQTTDPSGAAVGDE